MRAAAPALTWSLLPNLEPPTRAKRAAEPAPTWSLLHRSSEKQIADGNHVLARLADGGQPVALLRGADDKPTAINDNMQHLILNTKETMHASQ